MATFSITPINIDSRDIISHSRETINTNFKTSFEAVNSLNKYLDSSTGKIQNISEISVGNALSPALSSSPEILTINGNQITNGSLIVTRTITADKINVKNGLSVSGDNIELLNENGRLYVKGSIEVDGDVILKDMASPAIDASSIIAFSSNSQNNLIIDGGIPKAGRISLSLKNVLILDWSNWKEYDVLDNTNQNYLKEVELRTEGVKTGHTLEVISRLGPITGTFFKILPTTLANAPSGINFFASHQSARLIYDGFKWVVMNVHDATL